MKLIITNLKLKELYPLSKSKIIDITNYTFQQVQDTSRFYYDNKYDIQIKG
jgi:hypothetical protein